MLRSPDRRSAAIHFPEYFLSGAGTTAAAIVAARPLPRPAGRHCADAARRIERFDCIGIGLTFEHAVERA